MMDLLKPTRARKACAHGTKYSLKKAPERNLHAVTFQQQRVTTQLNILAFLLLERRIDRRTLRFRLSQIAFESGLSLRDARLLAEVQINVVRDAVCESDAIFWSIISPQKRQS